MADRERAASRASEPDADLDDDVRDGVRRDGDRRDHEDQDRARDGVVTSRVAPRIIVDGGDGRRRPPHPAVRRTAAVAAALLVAAGAFLVVFPFDVTTPTAVLQCGPPVFEVLVPADAAFDGPENVMCGTPAGHRLAFGVVALVAFLAIALALKWAAHQRAPRGRPAASPVRGSRVHAQAPAADGDDRAVVAETDVDGSSVKGSYADEPFVDEPVVDEPVVDEPVVDEPEVHQRVDVHRPVDRDTERLFGDPDGSVGEPTITTRGGPR